MNFISLKENPTCYKHLPSTPHCLECGFTEEKGYHFNTLQPPQVLEGDLLLDRYIDITPTWTELLPEMLSVFRVVLDTKAKEGLYLELKRMAKAADNWNEYVRNRNAD